MEGRLPLPAAQHLPRRVAVGSVAGGALRGAVVAAPARPGALPAAVPPRRSSTGGRSQRVATWRPRRWWCWAPRSCCSGCGRSTGAERVRRLLSRSRAWRWSACFVGGSRLVELPVAAWRRVGPRAHTRKLVAIRPGCAGSRALPGLRRLRRVGAAGRPGLPPVPPGRSPSAMPIGLQANKPWVYGAGLRLGLGGSPRRATASPYVLTIREATRATPPDFRLVRQTRHLPPVAPGGRHPKARLTLPGVGRGRRSVEVPHQGGPARVSRLPGEASLLPPLTVRRAGLRADPRRQRGGAPAPAARPVGGLGQYTRPPGTHGGRPRPLHSKLPANLDRPGPFYDAGTVVQLPRPACARSPCAPGSAPLDPLIAVSLPSAVASHRVRPAPWGPGAGVQAPGRLLPGDRLMAGALRVGRQGGT